MAFQHHAHLFGKIWFHVDSGANILAVADRKCLGFFVPYPLPYKDVNGGIRFGIGYGIMFLRFPPHPKVYPVGPVFVSPDAVRNSLSLSALLRYCSFREATESMLSHCTFTDYWNNSFRTSCAHHNGLDFIQAEVITFDSSLLSKPSISALTVTSKKSLSQEELYKDAHLRLGHVNLESLSIMSRKQVIKDLPVLKKIPPIACRCCFRQNRKHIPRNPIDTTRPRIMSYFSVDFTFYSHLSIRGHNCAFILICKATGYPFGFSCAAKRPPVSIMQFFVRALRNLGFTPAIFKMDEGGDLAKSTDFCQALSDMGLIINSSGGNNKTGNGLVERLHQTLHQMTRSTLATFSQLLPSVLPLGIRIESFWDLCLGYMVQIKRILYSPHLGDSPYFVIHKRRPSLNDYPVFGSPCEVVMPNKDKARDKLNSASNEAFFVGKGSNSGAFLIWSPSNPTNLTRAHHVHINSAASFSHHDGLFQLDRSTDPRPPYKVLLRQLSSPFLPEEVFSYTLEVPIEGLSPLGLRIIDNEEWNIPKLESCVPGTLAYNIISPSHRRNMHIVSINGVEPITAQSAIELIIGARRLRSNKLRTIILELSKCKSRSRTAYEQLRGQFDAIPPIIATLHSSVLASHVAILPSPPIVPKLAHQAFSGPYGRNFKAATIKGYDDNANLGVYGAPKLRTELPPDTTILPSVLAPSIKEDHDFPHRYTFKVRHTVNGGGMEEGKDFKTSYSPVCAHGMNQ